MIRECIRMRKIKNEPVLPNACSTGVEPKHEGLCPLSWLG